MNKENRYRLLISPPHSSGQPSPDTPSSSTSFFPATPEDTPAVVKGSGSITTCERTRRVGDNDYTNNVAGKKITSSYSRSESLCGSSSSSCVNEVDGVQSGTIMETRGSDDSFCCENSSNGGSVVPMAIVDGNNNCTGLPTGAEKKQHQQMEDQQQQQHTLCQQQHNKLPGSEHDILSMHDNLVTGTVAGEAAVVQKPDMNTSLEPIQGVPDQIEVVEELEGSMTCGLSISGSDTVTSSTLSDDQRNGGTTQGKIDDGGELKVSDVLEKAVQIGEDIEDINSR